MSTRAYQPVRPVYPKDTPTLPSDYELGVKKVAAKQVVLAGYRLADVLNAALAAPAPSIPARSTPK